MNKSGKNIKRSIVLLAYSSFGISVNEPITSCCDMMAVRIPVIRAILSINSSIRDSVCMSIQEELKAKQREAVIK